MHSCWLLPAFDPIVCSSLLTLDCRQGIEWRGVVDVEKRYPSIFISRRLCLKCFSREILYWKCYIEIFFSYTCMSLCCQQESVSGVLDVVEKYSRDQSGGFLDHTGATLPW